jgi:hypothetical protein
MAASATKPLLLTGFCTWADAPENAAGWYARSAQEPIDARVADPRDPDLVRKARLDRDWHARSIRCWEQLRVPNREMAPALVVGPTGLAELAQRAPEIAARSEPWLILYGHHPQSFASAAPALFAFLRKVGWRILFYAFDEASREMPCFRAIAPYLDVLIHDESPLDPTAERLLPQQGVRVHRSWVANLVPFEAPFIDEPEKRIVFLGSQMGLTPHRKRQIDFLKAHFKDRFLALCDHSLPVGDHLSLARYKVSVCPEGRKFATRAMSATHTDRPFWSGCLGLVPVAEDSRQGGRLDELAQECLILRYPHGDLQALRRACEEALDATLSFRDRVYSHFNRDETVGSSIAAALARTPPSATVPNLPARPGNRVIHPEEALIDQH